MKLAVVLAALLAPSLGFAVETCQFPSSTGAHRVVFEDDGSVRLFGPNGGEIAPGSCRYENAFRRSSLRCPYYVNQDERIELYRSYFPRRTPNFKTSLVIWRRLSSANPSVENSNGKCD